MKRKITVLVLMLASMVIFLPAESRAAVTEDKTNSASEYNYAAQIRVRIGNQRRRNRRWDRNDDRWNRNRNYGQWRRNQNRRARYVTQTFWRNGRRYTRTVRVY
jgi:hypothetical protein